MQIEIVAVNIGRLQPLEVGGETRQSGTFKQPAAGAFDVGRDGIAADAIGDRSRHGGVDQALYLFGAEDNAWWAAQLGRAVGPGFFGENLTWAGAWPEPRVGDRLCVHSSGLELELTFPRIPCATLAARVGDTRFLQRFVAANRAGFYARVLQPGRVTAGNVAQLVPAEPTAPTLAALFAAWHDRPAHEALLRRALQTPIAERGRRAIENWLAGRAGAGRSSLS
jgi:MOSC domain-containing protein YiiM